jgi:hypothetical protein
MPKKAKETNTDWKHTFTHYGMVISIYLIHKFIDECAKIKDLEVTKVKMEDLEHLFYENIWRKGCLSYNIMDVIHDDRFINDRKQIEKADLSYPIILTKDPIGILNLLDGAHRISLSLLQNKKTINAYVFNDPKLWDKFKLGKDSKELWDWIDNSTKKQFDDLFKKRFKKCSY